MRTARYLRHYSDAALEACWLVAAALAPLYVDHLRAQPTAAKGPLVQLLVTLMVLLWLVQRAAARRGQRPEDGDQAGARGPGTGLFVALAAASALTSLLSAALAPVPETAFWGSYLRGEGAYATVSYAALFLVVMDRLRTRVQLDRLVTVLLATSVPVCLYGVAQAARLDPLTWQQDVTVRVIATAGNSIFLAAYLILLLPLVAWRLLDHRPRQSTSERGSWWGPLALAGAVGVLAVIFRVSATHPQGWWAAPAAIAAFALVAAVLPPLPCHAMGRWVRRPAYLLLLLLQAWVLVLTASRGPVLAIVGALVLLPAVVAVRRRRWRPLLLTGGGLALILVGLAALSLPSSPLEPFKQRVVLLQRLSSVDELGIGARLVVWRVAADAVARPGALVEPGDPLAVLRPLVGYGPESITYVLNQVLPPPHRLGGGVGVAFDRAHNVLLDRLLGTGVFGLAAYLALVGVVLVVAYRRVLPELDARRWGPQTALLLVLLGHILESQFSMLVVPAEVVFWLLAGAAVGACARAAPTEQGGAPAAAIPLAAQSPAPPWRIPVAIYGTLVLLGVVALCLGPAPERVLGATIGSLGAFTLAPFVGALALAPPPGPRTWGVGVIALAGPASALALLVNAHQVAALAADVAFKRADRAPLPGAIAATQQAIRLAPPQAEYYHLLGQYYAALGGSTRAAPLPGFEPSLREALTAQPTALGRDQLIALGRVSLEEAVRRNPLEARYHATLGELYRYWAEVAAEPAYLPAALASFERAASLKPNDVDIHAGMADVLLLRGEPGQAVAVGLHARELLPTYWYPHAVLARAYLVLGQPSQALEAAQAALDSAHASGISKPPSPFELDRLQRVVSAARAALS